MLREEAASNPERNLAATARKSALMESVALQAKQ
jgi:hypothetical protein